MKIVIIGAGAIGSLVAGYLKLNNNDVLLLDRNIEDLNACEKTVKISGIRGNFEVKIPCRRRLAENAEVIVLAVKTQDIANALDENKSYIKNSIIISTQNGIKAESLIEEQCKTQKIIRTIVMFGATYLGDNEVIHNFDGKWIFGISPENSDINITKVISILSQVFPISCTCNIPGMKWLKLFINANNCIAAVLGKSMQECFSNVEVCKIAMAVWSEGISAVNKADISLESIPDFPKERVIDLVSLPIEKSASIYSSIMKNISKEPVYGSILQSIKRNRTSEIDYINGEFISLGNKEKIEFPVNKLLIKLVKDIENGGEFLSIKKLICIYDKTVNGDFHG